MLRWRKCSCPLCQNPLIGAIDGQHWQDVKRDRRTEILVRLDDMGIAPK